MTKKYEKHWKNIIRCDRDNPEKSGRYQGKPGAGGGSQIHTHRHQYDGQSEDRRQNGNMGSDMSQRSDFNAFD